MRRVATSLGSRTLLGRLWASELLGEALLPRLAAASSQAAPPSAATLARSFRSATACQSSLAEALRSGTLKVERLNWVRQLGGRRRSRLPPAHLSRFIGWCFLLRPPPAKQARAGVREAELCAARGDPTLSQGVPGLLLACPTHGLPNPTPLAAPCCRAGGCCGAAKFFLAHRVKGRHADDADQAARRRAGDHRRDGELGKSWVGRSRQCAALVQAVCQTARITLFLPTLNNKVNNQPEEELVEDESGAIDADVGAVFTATVTKGARSLV